MALQAIPEEITDFWVLYGRTKYVLLVNLSQKLAFLGLSCYTRGIMVKRVKGPKEGLSCRDVTNSVRGYRFVLVGFLERRKVRSLRVVRAPFPCFALFKSHEDTF